MKRWLQAVFWLTSIYLLTVASVQPWDWLIGVTLATLLYSAHRRVLPFGPRAEAPALWKRLLHAPRFAAAVAAEVVTGTWRVALLTLGLRPPRQPQIVAIPITDRTLTGVAVSGLVHTLTPSSYLVDVDWESGVILFQILDAEDPDAVREHMQRFYRRYQRWVFP